MHMSIGLTTPCVVPSALTEHMLTVLCSVLMKNVMTEMMLLLRGPIAA